jgi:hypothetical protein
MEDRSPGEQPFKRATAELNRVVDAVNAEIAARRTQANDAAAIKRHRRFAAAKAARLSEAADLARAAAQQLKAAKARVMDEVAKAEAAGFTVHDDWSVTDPTSGSSDRATEADDRAEVIKAAVNDLVALDEQVAAGLYAAVEDLKDLSDN